MHAHNTISNQRKSERSKTKSFCHQMEMRTIGPMDDCVTVEMPPLLYLLSFCTKKILRRLTSVARALILFSTSEPARIRPN